MRDTAMYALNLLRSYFARRPECPNDRDLADLGLSRVDFDLLTHSARGTRTRMEALAARFGVTPRQIDRDRGMALELAETCGHCSESSACQRALDGKGTFETARCPNAARYLQLSEAAARATA
jgi:hypothetical protein